MSLNRVEQMVFNYVQDHVDELRFWKEKVHAVGTREQSDHDAVAYLEPELWRYFEERSNVTEPFKSFVAREGRRKISMKNLAEYWLRIWGPIRAKKKKGSGEAPVVPY